MEEQRAYATLRSNACTLFSDRFFLIIIFNCKRARARGKDIVSFHQQSNLTDVPKSSRALIACMKAEWGSYECTGWCAVKSINHNLNVEQVVLCLRSSISCCFLIPFHKINHKNDDAIFSLSAVRPSAQVKHISSMLCAHICAKNKQKSNWSRRKNNLERKRSNNESRLRGHHDHEHLIF